MLLAPPESLYSAIFTRMPALALPVQAEALDPHPPVDGDRDADQQVGAGARAAAELRRESRRRTACWRRSGPPRTARRVAAGVVELEAAGVTEVRLAGGRRRVDAAVRVRRALSPHWPVAATHTNGQTADAPHWPLAEQVCTRVPSLHWVSVGRAGFRRTGRWRRRTRTGRRRARPTGRWRSRSARGLRRCTGCRSGEQEPPH